jgi:hypothetical protein
LAARAPGFSPAAGEPDRWPVAHMQTLKYEIKSHAPDMLFQGGLTDPPKQAAALGFKGTAITTLETGCASELDFHMVDADIVLFGLNDRIYTLTRSK